MNKNYKKKTHTYGQKLKKKLKSKQKMALQLVHSTELNTTLLSFQHAIKIFINKPQVVNKWVAGSTPLDSTSIKINDYHTEQAGSNQIIELRTFLTKSNKIFRNITYLIIDSLTPPSNTILFIPIIDNSDNNDLKYPAVSFKHSFQLDTALNKLNIYAEVTNDATYEQHLTWLTATLVPKLVTWSACITTDDHFTCANATTLTLYPRMLDEYVPLYLELKSTYWPRFAPIWVNETGTEPDKFIHEDIAIACYLILTWRHFNLNVQRFVDLGCGNGLLVYILNDQGFGGYGVDMRARKIWSNRLFVDGKVKLVEQTVEPKSSDFLEPGTDFLIGNHSDELSPWMPVLAWRAKCSYLLIPCCMFDFNGKFGFVKKSGGETSRNEAYLVYMKRIGERFGFEMRRDKLRIPSTKNVVFLGINREVGQMNEDLDEIVRQRINELTFNDR
jgi:tRNASer (uridine44-2'-O)-methyltransferase